MPYCLPVIVCRGQLSTTYINNYFDRASEAIKRGQRLVVLHFGDFDPTGVQIPLSVESRLREVYHLGDELVVHRWGLTQDHVWLYSLPNNPEAFKQQDPNASRFMAKYGRMSVELDALSPEVLMNEIEAGIKHYLDMDTIDNELQIQKQEAQQIAHIRRKIITTLEAEGIQL